MYKKTNYNNSVYWVEQNSYIPFDLANTDYQAYLKWLAEGNTPLPADEPVVEPTPVIEEPVVAEPAVDEAPPAEEPNEG